MGQADKIRLFKATPEYPKYLGAKFIKRKGKNVMEKITFAELRDAMYKFNEEHPDERFNRKLTGVVVFTEDSFTAPYTEVERSYRVDNSQKAFRHSTCSNSIWADCLDGKDLGVRIDLYMYDGWKVDYCYLEEIKA